MIYMDVLIVSNILLYDRNIQIAKFYIRIQWYTCRGLEISQSRYKFERSGHLQIS